MLRLDQTALLLDALRPPRGMELDVAVGSTFTLDLTALLTIPVSAGFDSITVDAEPADLLETVRRYAERTVLFCQAGAIGVPSEYRSVHTMIEDTVVEVKKPDSGIFHPKFWIVRFTAPGQELHRVLVLSRNLTFDRAWDVLVRLDEEDKSAAAMDTGGLLEMLDLLPTMAARPLTTQQTQLLASLRSSLSRARLAVPAPFTKGRFAPLTGTGGRKPPFKKKCDKALAVSPFLTADAVKSFFSTGSRRSIIVSRPGALNAHAEALRGVHEIYRVKDELIAAQQDLEGFDAIAEPSKSELPDYHLADLGRMRGLHAKFYIQDHGHSATAWLGSANLTGAAFGANVDLLVELEGDRSAVGVNAVISRGGRRDDLSWIVEPHELSTEASDADDPEEGLFELDAHLFELASCNFHIGYTMDADGQSGPWRADLLIDPYEAVPGIDITARPLSLLAAREEPVTGGRVSWSGLLQEEITPFVVVSVRSDHGHRRVLVRADLVGDPPERRRAVIAQAIRSPDDFFRYLAALLALEAGGGGLGAGQGGAGEGAGWLHSLQVDRILEDLLTTASRHPRRLESLNNTLVALRADERFSEVVPAAFEELWNAVYSARKGAIG